MSRSLPPPTVLLLLLLLLFFFKGAKGSSNAAGESKIRCLEVERQALLNIKEALHEIQEGFLSSWGNEEEKRDCCEWYGIRCANNSDHVTVLDLTPSNSRNYDEDVPRRMFLQGNISPSLRKLKHLTYLDLSLINFTGHGIPSFIGTLTKLRYLNLSFTEMSGEIPPQLGNISSLEVLDLGYNNDLRMKSMGWVSHLSSLRLLDLSRTNMIRAIDWMQVVTKLPHLTNLQLGECNLPIVLSSSLSLVNSSTSLAILDLQYNQLSVSIYQWVFSFSPSLVHLDLSSNALEGSIPEALGNMSSLVYLVLSANKFEGTIPEALGNLTKLTYLNLEYNDLEGSIPEALGNLIGLTDLNLQYNLLEGSIPEGIGNLTGLIDLNLENNDLEGSIPEALGNLIGLSDLNLQFNHLEGFIPEALGNLTGLTDLNLQHNLLEGSIPEGIGNLTGLTDLNLENNDLEGSIPEALGNLIRLSDLNLQFNHLEGFIPEALGNLTGLTDLNLEYNHLEGSIPEALGKLTGLTDLNLDYNQLEGSIPEALGNLIGLTNIYLEHNHLEGSIPDALGNLTGLTDLNLEHNRLEGSIPEALGNLTKLTFLDLGYNNLEGELPNSLGNLCMLRELSARGNNLSGLSRFELTQSFPRCTYNSLEFLDLSYNRFRGSLPNLTIFPSLKGVYLSCNQYNGTISETIGQLAQLESLQLGGNSLEGVITEAHFSKLTKLFDLSLSDNSLTLKFNDHWVPPFQLGFISLRSCMLGPHFPRWLQTQNSFSLLDISNNGISDSIPDWLEFHGTAEIDLSSNKLEGSIPPFLFNVGALNLSTNRFSRLSSICNVTNDSSLGFLDISFNQLSGEIPDCWSPFKRLKVLLLENNKFSGEIPTSIGSLTEITALHLGKNSLTKELPSALKNCTSLVALVVEENRLEGPIPQWIGESVPELLVLSLRSNHFSGSIPSQLCHLPNLQLLDLSLNNISGSVPRCLKNLTAMKKSWNNENTAITHGYDFRSPGLLINFLYQDDVDLVWKGTLSKFSNTLGLVKSIDLSSNKLMGEIPTEITQLIHLVSLNLSRNNFSGRIPSEIGKLTLLDVLDLSNNQLSGGIPSSLTEVDRLNVLNLSNNHLSGKIPTGTQLQSFEASSYTGNPELCGAPLPKRCPGDEPTVSTAPAAHDEEEDQDKFVTRGFYVTLGLGFVVGFWGVCGSLIFSRTWRYSYFNFLNDVNDWIYVMVAVHKAKLLRMIKN